MTKNTPAGDRSTVTRTAWERPAMVRLDAADAEMMDGGGSDGMSMRSMNS